MKTKTSVLTGAALDWAVVKCLGKATFIGTQAWAYDENGEYRIQEPSTDWAQGGPIIEREKIWVSYWPVKEWQAQNWEGKYSTQGGPTPLIAAMRGDEVDVPKELT
jgi:Protein of unknown function (DUF2591)